jgi:hypothetical protein
VTCYKYAGTGSDYKWEEVLRRTDYAGFNSVFEFKTPLSILGIAPGQAIGIHTEDWYGWGWWETSFIIPFASYPPTAVADDTPPSTMLSVGSPSYRSGETVYVSGSTFFTISATDDASGVRETRYRVDGGSWETYSEGFTLSACDEGQHAIGYCSLDNAGNSEAEKTMIVTLDKAPPAISSASPKGSMSMMSTPSQVTFSARVEDTGSGVKEVTLIVDGITQGAMNRDGDAYTKTLSLSQGDHTWSIEAVDNVGNTAAQSNTFSITRIPLEIIIVIAIIIGVIIIVILVSRRRRLPPPPPS